MSPLAAGCAALLLLPAAWAEDGASYPLDRAAYRFCHEPGYQADQARAWCDLLVDVPPERCPGLRRTCADPSLHASAGCAPGGGGGGVPGHVGGAPGEPTPEPEGCAAPGFPPPGGAHGAGIVRWIGAFAVALVIAVILRLLVAWFGRFDRERLPAPSTPTPHEAGEDLPDAPSEDLIARARAALEAGDAARAVELARSAALRRLAETRRLALHASRTDREYVRAVRAADRDLGDTLAGIVAAVEAHRFGGRRLDLPRAREVLRSAERIVLAALVLMALVAPADARAQGRYGPFGDAALRELFEQHGFAPRWLDGGLGALTVMPHVIVLDASGFSADGDDWNWLAAWVENGGVLVLGGDPRPGFPRLGGRALLERPAPVETDLGMPYGLPAPVWPGGVDHVWVGIDAEPWVNAVGGDVGEPVPGTRRLAPGERAPTVALLRVGGGVVLAIADDRLLSNGALVHPDNERFLVEAVRMLAGDGRLDVLLATRTVEASPPVRTVAANPRMIPFVLQLALTWTLLVLWKGWPFGVRRDPPDEGRARFVEHVHALAARWAQLGATGWAFRASARLWLHRLGPEGLELAARRAGHDPASARRFVAEVEAAARGDGEGKDPASLEKVEALWRITSR